MEQEAVKNSFITYVWSTLDSLMCCELYVCENTRIVTSIHVGVRGFKVSLVFTLSDVRKAQSLLFPDFVVLNLLSLREPLAALGERL